MVAPLPTSALGSSSSVVNEVKFDSLTQSKIVNVSLYSNRAEVSRAYTKFKVAPGQNQVVLSSLPNLLDRTSIRVEGRGAASIQDVTISCEIAPRPPATSPKLRELQVQKEDLENALRRCKKTQDVLESYINKLNFNTQSLSEGKVDILPVIDSYDEAAEKYDKKEMELRRQLKTLELEMDEERALLWASVSSVDPHRSMMATVSIFAESEGDLEVILKYAMLGNASWTALYDIRVNTEAKEQPVEEWTNAPVTLETAMLTLDQSVPELKTWNLSIYKPAPPPFSSRDTPRSLLGYGKKDKKVSPRWAQPESYSADCATASEASSDECDEEGGASTQPVVHATAAVTSKGSVNATFRIPGLITIPSDCVAHNVTVATLTPEAKLTWLSVPSADSRVHLTAVLKNTSEYTLPEGSSGITVDGSFISKSTVPLVSPQESFTCALGYVVSKKSISYPIFISDYQMNSLDPSIRITYDPRAKKASQSGIISKTSSTVFTQRISVHNTKSIAVDNLKIVDRIPVSEDSQITVKLISPVLPTNSTSAGSSLNLSAITGTLTKRVKLADGVVAQWYGADEEATNAEYLGKDGKVQWLCSLPSQKKVDLTLQWEVSVPKEVVVVGL
ncbi:hypothetical protein H1R20_g16407, partial [Candolleomyces eurysporus]